MKPNLNIICISPQIIIVYLVSVSVICVLEKDKLCRLNAASFDINVYLFFFKYCFQYNVYIWLEEASRNEVTFSLRCFGFLRYVRLKRTLPIGRLSSGLSSPPLAPHNNLRGDNCIQGSPSTAGPVMLFVLAQLLLGCGGSPLFTLGTTYIDDHVRPESASLYIGKKIYHSIENVKFIFGKLINPVLFIF